MSGSVTPYIATISHALPPVNIAPLAIATLSLGALGGAEARVGLAAGRSIRALRSRRTPRLGYFTPRGGFARATLSGGGGVVET